jgi:hypothetical protein
MTYSFYLFLNLRIVICPNETEYDIQYGDDKKLYMTYESSKYNDAKLPEYECMVNFLNAYKQGLIGACYDVDNMPLMKYDWVVLLNDKCIAHDHITPSKGDVLQFIRQNDEDPTIGEFLHLPTNQPLNIFADRTLKLNK